MVASSSLTIGKEFLIHRGLLYYALINRAQGPYEEIFVLTFKAYGPNAVRLNFTELVHCLLC